MFQVLGNRVCTRISFFWFRKRSGKSELVFLPMTKIQLKWVHHKLGQRSVDAPSTGRFHEASGGPEKSFVQHGLVEKKKRQTSWIIDSFFKEAKNLKKPNTTDLERDLQRPRLRRSTINRRRWTWTPYAGRSSCFFFCFVFLLRRLTNLDLRFLLWK